MCLQREISDSNARRYYSDVGKSEILDAPTERELFLRFQQTQDPVARDRIIKSALRFVIKLAKNYARDPDTTKDLISAGNVGLLKAFDRYDPSHGTRFLSYATSWVLLEMRNELYNSGIVSMPLWRQKALGKIAQTNTRAMAARGCRATTRELQKNVDLTSTQLQRLQECESLQISALTDDMPSNGNGNGNGHLDGLAINKESRLILGDLIRGFLSVKEQFVIRAYFGWVGDPMSLRQIATVLGVSSERVRQIKTDALRLIEKKLRYRLGIRQEGDVRS